LLGPLSFACVKVGPEDFEELFNRRQNIVFAASVGFEPNFFYDPGQRPECMASRGN
jgi:hypothetical protein